MGDDCGGGAAQESLSGRLLGSRKPGRVCCRMAGEEASRVVAPCHIPHGPMWLLRMDVGEGGWPGAGRQRRAARLDFAAGGDGSLRWSGEKRVLMEESAVRRKRSEKFAATGHFGLE